MAMVATVWAWISAVVAVADKAPPMKFHLPTRCSEGDINAIFQYKGMWHLSHQWRLRPATAVGHQVSQDLLHWTRVADALASGPTADQQCFDGSASLVEKDGVLQPILMIDGGCGMKGPGNQGCMESTGTDTGGVTAFPEDLDDPYLRNWTKFGPTIFQGCNHSAGPSPIWKNGDKYNLIAIHFGVEARFEALDNTFGAWKMADPKFISQRGGGGSLWHELPANVDGVEDKAWATHTFQANGALGDGRPTFILGVYDPESETYSNITAPRPVDVSKNVAYGQLSHSEPGGDPRTLHISWLTGVVYNDCATDGAMTSIRDLRFDPRVDLLVETPIKEYEQLRNSQLFSTTRTLVAGDPAVVLYTGEQGTTMDMELSISARDGFKAGTTIHIGTRCDSSGAECTTVSLAIASHIMHHVAACDQCGKAPKGQSGSWCDDPACIAFAWDADHVQGSDLATVGCDILREDSRTYCLHGGSDIYAASKANVNASSIQVTMTISGGASSAMPATFPLLKSETSLSLRVMSDTRTIEIFAAGGRGVFSAPLNSTSGAVTASVEGGNVDVTATGWALASIFEAEEFARFV
eukprot:TRINITY_DN71218_c0_g1_i1.p1 TRINITY_DN71218_c0_g1~~TRINITY_DN71218_c0_g1_i1.p1  ORF type:complete len:599 (-),score=106.27 TRINITY_DN71218_c0_g1_i1:288-2030(-)